jgi:hypothetical protein
VAKLPNDVSHGNKEKASAFHTRVQEGRGGGGECRKHKRFIPDIGKRSPVSLAYRLAG